VNVCSVLLHCVCMYKCVGVCVCARARAHAKSHMQIQDRVRLNLLTDRRHLGVCRT
jgi:hypothetical protein